MRLFSMNAALAALIAAGAAAGARAETVTVEGTGTGMAKSEQMPVAEGTVLIHNMVEFEGFETSDPESPFASLSGPCFGAAMVDGGQASGSGLCHYTDADGDMAVMEWTVTGMSQDQRITGDWTVRGGTGKWEQASGGGTFDAGGEGADYTNMVTGEVEMP